MTNFNKLRLGALVAIGMTITTLTACVIENSPTIASPSSPTPIAAASPTPSVAASVAAVPPVETPVTVTAGSTSKATPLSPSPLPSAAPPAKPDTSTTSKIRLCKSNEGAIINVETKNYLVAICGKGEPEFYVGVEKEDPTKSIRLPLNDFSPGFYAAANGNTTYILAKTPKGHFLTVTQGNKELLREVVSGWGN